jgi:DNA-binding transcriptional ArsR family regulator
MSLSSSSLITKLPSFKEVLGMDQIPVSVDKTVPETAEIPVNALSRLADYFKVLSEVSRLQILCTLKKSAKNVSEIMESTGMGQANVSKHLKMLTQAGLVSRHPQGVSVYYQISDPTIFELCDLVSSRLFMQLQTQSQELEQLTALKQD